MSNTVFILGAGASKEAGGPLMKDFLDIADDLRKKGDLGADAPNFDLVFKGIAALQAVHSKSTLDLINIESVFAAFEMALLLGRLGNLDPKDVQGLSVAIRRLIVKTLQMRIVFPVSNDKVKPAAGYDTFAQLVKDISTSNPEQASVITFNYDLAIDQAFYWNGIPIDYCLDSNVNPRSVQIMKLHGSLNWARCGECQAIVPWQLDNYFSKYTWNIWGSEATQVRLDIADQLTELAHCSKATLPEPVIVPPTWNKVQHYQKIDNVWSRAAQNLAEAENIIIIGYSLPQTDQFFRYLYALGTVSDVRLKHFWVFDPDSSSEFRSRYEELLGPTAKERFDLQQKTFVEAVSIIRSKLGVSRR